MMADFPDIEPDLEEIGLIANNQVYDSILTGQVQTASLSGAKWTCAPTFSNRNGKEARDLRAFIFGQNGVSGRFNYYPASIDNAGTHAGLGVVDGAGQTGSTLETTGWDANQPLLFAAGDYITANGEMKMVTADVPVGQDYIEYDETNYMQSPFDPEGWYHIGDPDGTITNVVITNPSGESFVGLVEVTDSYIICRTNTPDLQAGIIGDDFRSAILYKPLNVSEGDRLQSVLFSTGGESERIELDAITFEPTSPTDLGKFLVTDLSDGFKLIQFSGIALNDASNYGWQISLNPLATGPGASCYVQAAFFGKATDWPAKLRANATIPITPPMRTSPADGTLIEANNPYFQGRLESDDMSRLQVSSPVIYNATLSIVEAF